MIYVFYLIYPKVKGRDTIALGFILISLNTDLEEMKVQHYRFGIYTYLIKHRFRRNESTTTARQFPKPKAIP